ncbi:hypothetical protein QUF74_04425 [Candidatus Halobeggiatoa sp. HSG11]|nr:hypothetical protein [Candidatus Halobeggiatoa sp. HSG11]
METEHRHAILKKLFYYLVGGIFVAIIIPLIIDKSEIIDCFRGGNDCKLKANLYTYDNNHQYTPFGKEKSIKIYKNNDLKQCDSYDIKFDFEKVERWWIPNSWSVVNERHIYIFQVDRNDDKIYDIDMLFNDSFLVSKGDLYLPNDGHFSLHDSELGKKEIYLLDFEKPKEYLDKEYETLSDGGQKHIFYDNFLKKYEPVLSFDLKDNIDECPPKVEVDYQYLSKNGDGKWQSLKNEDVLQVGNYFRVNFKTFEDLYIYFFIYDEEGILEVITSLVKANEIESHLFKAAQYEIPPSSGRQLGKSAGKEKLYFLALRNRDVILEQYYSNQQSNVLINYLEKFKISKEGYMSVIHVN